MKDCGENGTLTFMVGGDNETYKQIMPLFEVMGNKSILCGPAGSGQATKMCNNLLLAITMSGLGEAIKLANSQALDMEKFYQVLSTSTGSCWALNNYCPIKNIGPTSPADNNFKPGFSSELMLKDLSLALDAASKKSNELMSFAYSNIYKIPCVGLRFFTVYGPWGRPDMAYFKFTKNIIEDIPIDVYGNGDMYRDFTYIDDIIDGIFKLINIPNQELFLNKNNLYELFNIGNDNPINLKYFISIIEECLGKSAKMNFLVLAILCNFLEVSMSIVEQSTINVFCLTLSKISVQTSSTITLLGSMVIIISFSLLSLLRDET